MSGRIRTVKPEILEDAMTAGLSHEAWRLFVSLFVIADDYGNFRASDRYLDGVVFWARESDTGVSRLVRELVASGLITTYEVRDQAYGHVAGWSKHQKVDRPGKPRCPGPEEAANTNGCEIREEFASDSRGIPVTLATDLRPPTSTNDQEGTRVASPRVSANKPELLGEDWLPPGELVEALAAKHAAEPERIQQTVPEFRWFWRSGKGAGKKRSPKGWNQAFVHRIGQLAKSEELYAGARQASGAEHQGVIKWAE